MSDGIIRICREHDMELRQIGAHLVCPRGHTCDVDWYVQQAASRLAPSLPLPVVEVSAPREAEKARSTTSPKEKRMPKTQSHTRGEVHPHGTYQRYFQEAKAGAGTCEPCRRAASAYAKEKRDARLAAAGKPVKQARARAAKTAPAREQPRKTAALIPREKPRHKGVVPRSQGSDLENEVLRLRADLVEAEQAYLAHVRKLLPGLA